MSRGREPRPRKGLARLEGSRSLLVALAALVVPAAACTDENPFEVIEEVTFFPGLMIDLSTMTKLPSGVYIKDDSVGTGALLADGDSVYIDHTGWLASGIEFSTGEFRALYPGTFIQGFAIGLEGMAEGGQRLMIIPPALAYADNPPTTSIPPGAILVFEVELLDAY
jgi:hypothetical protein